MKGNLIVWILSVPLFLFFLAMFYIEVSTYSVLPPEQDGMNLWTELKGVWYRSIWFYAMLITGFTLMIFHFINSRHEKASN
ncbi:hypothetical protein AB5N96_08110 [Chryseomicrobium imtechense]